MRVVFFLFNSLLANTMAGCITMPEGKMAHGGLTPQRHLEEFLREGIANFQSTVERYCL